jgi:hypothetical protein
MMVYFFEGDKLIGESNVVGVGISEILGMGGFVFAFIMDNDDLFEKMFIHYVDIKTQPEFKVTRFGTGILDYMDGKHRLIVYGTPTAYRLMIELVKRGCGWGFTDSKGERIMWMGRPCSRERIKAIVAEVLG